MAKLPRITRRRFYGSLAAGAAGLFLYAWRVEPHWLEVVKRDLVIAHLPEALVGQSLIQISDLHVGDIVDADYLIASLELISSLRPAMTVITGDFMTCHGDEHIEAVIRVMRHLTPGPLGCFAILGNHDYAMDWSRSAVADKLVGKLAEVGIRTLRNECQDVGGLQLVGLDDLWGPHFQPEGVLATVDWAGPALTLCHNPDAVDLAALSACRGWILSGHTHGGQCKPPFLPPPLLPVKNKRYTAGAFDIGAGRNLYINRGLGYLRRIRFNVRPEITVFRLGRA
jgi:predicted MPP superfamily phosphohydrolase